MPARIGSFLWLVWVAVLVALTKRVFLWHLDYFSSPGPNFYKLALVFLPGLAIASWVYAAIRRPKLYRHEFAALAILVVGACVGYEPRAALVSAALFLACCATGRFVLGKLGLDCGHPIDRLATAFCAGAGILITLLSAAGLLGLFYAVLFLTLLILPLAFFRKEVAGTLFDLGDLNRRWRESSELDHPIAAVAVVFGFVAAICMLMIVLTPGLSYDPVVIHLPSVRYYAAQHTLRPVPGIDYSYYPQGMEVLWTLGYALAGQAGAQMISVLFFGVFLAMLFRFARLCGVNGAAAVTAAVFTATLPFVHWSGSVLKNDLAMACFLSLGLYAFLRWRSGGDFRWIPVGAFFLAQAFGIKYVALFGAVPLAILYGYAAWRQPRRGRAAAAVASVFLIFVAVWPARAYWLTGNPVAPEMMGHAVGGSLIIYESSLAAELMKYAEIPWTLTFDGLGLLESVLPHPIGILLLAFAPLLLFGGRPFRWSRAQIACTVFAAIYLLYWVFIIPKVRYAVLPFGFLCVLASARLKSFYDAQKGMFGRLVRISLLGVQTYCLLVSLMGLMILGINGPQFAYFAGRLDKHAYLRAAMRAYGPVEFLDRTDRNHARIFGIKNLARAYAPDPENFGSDWCEMGPCVAAELVSKIQGYGAEYLILPEDLNVYQEVLELLGSPERLYRDAYFSVYRLRGLPEQGTRQVP